MGPLRYDDRDSGDRPDRGRVLPRARDERAMMKTSFQSLTGAGCGTTERDARPDFPGGNLAGLVSTSALQGSGHVRSDDHDAPG